MLDVPAEVGGFLTDKMGKRLSNDAHIANIFVYDAASGEYVTLEGNTFVGGYQVELREGKYKLAAVNYFYHHMPSPSDLAVKYYPQGAEFYAPENHTVWTSPYQSKKLNPLVMNKAPGSIAGSILDESTGLALASFPAAVFVYDQNGFLAAVSAYGLFGGGYTSEYRVGGLRPGSYYLILWTFRDCGFSCSSQGEWYGGMDLSPEELAALSPRMTIPTSAYAVIVGEGETGAIDFYVKK